MSPCTLALLQAFIGILQRGPRQVAHQLESGHEDEDLSWAVRVPISCVCLGILSLSPAPCLLNRRSRVSGLVSGFAFKGSVRTGQLLFYILFPGYLLF